jgi:hypothetical protein
MKQTTVDLVVRIYLDRGVLAILDSKGNQHNESGLQQMLEFDISQLKALGPDDAEKQIGVALLYCLEQLSPNCTGVRDYAQEAALARDTVTKALYAAANDGDSGSQYDLALTLISQAVQDQNWKIVEEAESWLRKSSAQGFEEATQYLATSWDANKAILAERINRN